MSLNGVVLTTTDRTNLSDDPGSCAVQPRWVDTTSVRPPAGKFGLELSQIYIPFAWYSVDANTDTIIIRDPAVPLTLFSIKITHQTYTGESFAVWLEEYLNDNSILGSDTWTVVFHVPTAKLTIANGDSQEFEFFGKDFDFTAEDILGLIGNTNSSSSGATWTSPFIIRVTHAQFVYVLVEWEGIRSLVTARSETPNLDRVQQSGYQAVVAVAEAPSGWLQACTINFAATPKWWVDKFPSTVHMELRSHDWKIINMNMADWLVHFRIFDLPGERTSDNHVILADPARPYLSNAPQDFNSDSMSNVRNPTQLWAREQRGTKRPAPNNTAITQPLRLNTRGAPR